METEELRLKLLKIRDGSAEVCKTADEVLAMLPAPDAARGGYEGDVAGHLRSIAEHGAGKVPYGSKGADSSQ